jgi:RNA polymerase sigma-70 factor, ECF subfamily
MLTEQDLIRVLLAEQTKVMAYLRSLVRRRDLVTDLFQEICVLAIQKRHEIADEEHLKKWMRTTARFQAMNLNRKREEFELSLDRDVIELMEPCWNSEDTTDQPRIFDALRHCMNGLSPAHRELLRRRFRAEQSYDEMAREMERSVNSLYAMFSRIYSALARCIALQMAKAN